MAALFLDRIAYRIAVLALGGIGGLVAAVAVIIALFAGGVHGGLELAGVAIVVMTVADFGLGKLFHFWT
ncbi:MAG: hypothetical protein ACRDFS_04220 [Chloroflexota bacterium]